MRTVGDKVRIVTLLLLFLLVFLSSFWFGLVPQRFSPFPVLSLDQAPGWFLDPQLSVLRGDNALCRAVLKEPHIDASPVPEQPIRDGCGVVNAFRFSHAGQTTLGVDKLTCEMAAAVSLWIEFEVQPAAQATFGSRVARIEDMGTFDCRNIIGNPIFASRRSQHATANAIDIAAFTLENGQRISVLKDWRGKGKEAGFLRAVHDRACRYFRVVLGPDYNDAHRNHFHLDRGLGWMCR